MANQKISALPAGTPPQVTDTVPVSRSGTNVGLALSDVSSTVLVPTSSFMAPSPLVTGETPPNFNPTMYMQDAQGNWHVLAGIDTQTSTPGTPFNPAGTFTWLRRTFFRDSLANTQGGKNAMVSFNHTFGTGVDSAGNQDRAVWISAGNPPNDTAPRYGMEALQIEFDLVGAPAGVAAVDSEYTALSIQMSDNHVGVLSAPNYGCNAIRSQYFRKSGTWGSVSPATIRAYMSSQTADDGHGSLLSAIYAWVNDSNGLSVNTGGVAVNIQAPTVRMILSNYGLLVGNHGTNTADWNIFSTSLDGTPTAGRNWFGGNVYVPNILTSASTINVTGSMNVTGAIKTTQLGAVPTPSVTAIGVTGATTWGYKIVAKDAQGRTAASTERTISNGNATLDTNNHNQLQAFNVAGATSYEFYRTTAGGSPSTTGLITTVTPNNSVGQLSFVVQDTGLAGDSSTPQSVNTTGQLAIVERIKPGTFTLAQLNALPDPQNGQIAYATDGNSGSPALMVYLGSWKLINVT